MRIGRNIRLFHQTRKSELPLIIRKMITEHSFVHTDGEIAFDLKVWTSRWPYLTLYVSGIRSISWQVNFTCQSKVQIEIGSQFSVVHFRLRRRVDMVHSACIKKRVARCVNTHWASVGLTQPCSRGWSISSASNLLFKDVLKVEHNNPHKFASKLRGFHFIARTNTFGH